MNAKELLTETANILNLEGWTQGDYGDNKKGYCLLGAFGEAVSHNGGDNDEVLRAYRELIKLTGGDIASYNDYPRRTKDQVLSLVHTAALAV